MGKFKFIFVCCCLLVLSLSIHSCKPEDEDVQSAPTLDFITGQGLTSKDGSIREGSSFKVNLFVAHNKNIETLKIRVSYDSGPDEFPINCGTCDTSIGKSSFGLAFSNTVKSSVGTEKWTFTVTDIDGSSTSKSLLFIRTPKPTPKPILLKSKLLGSQFSSDQGSSLEMYDFNSYLLSNAKVNSASIDLIYVIDAVERDVLCAPSSNFASKLLGGAFGVSTWSKRHATKIRKTSYTENQFNAMTNSKELLAEKDLPNPFQQEATKLENGQVIYVEPVSTSGRPALVLVERLLADRNVQLKILYEQE